MKKSVLVFLMSFLLLIGGMSVLRAQEQPAPKKDTVNMDTYAKPEVYYDVEDDKANQPAENKGNSSTIIIVVVAVVVIGGAAYFFTKKKK